MSMSVTGWSQQNIKDLSSFVRNFKNNNVSNNVTGLNPTGQNDFTKRMKEICSSHGLTGNVAWGVDKDGKFILLQDHANKDKIENDLNSDPTLKDVISNPDNKFDISKGGIFKTNGYDSAYFTEEAIRLYEEYEKNGRNPTSSIDEIASMLEWQANQRYSVVLTSDQQAELNKVGKTSFNSNTGKTTNITSDRINDLITVRSRLETEIKALLEKEGIDTSKIKNLNLNIRDVSNKNDSSGHTVKKVDTFNAPEVIGEILARPENKGLLNLVESYLNESQSINSAIKSETGISEADIAELMQGGMQVQNIQNEALQNLMANDAGLSGALESYLQPDQFFSQITSVSSKEAAERTAIHGLEEAIMSGLRLFKNEMSEDEYNHLMQNLTVTVNSNGEYSVSGTSNEKILEMIGSFAEHYTSGAFADALKDAELLHQAEYGTSGGSGVTYTISFADENEPNSVVAYGDAYTEEEEANVKADISKQANQLINKTLEDFGRVAMEKPVEISVNSEGKLSAKVAGSDPSSKIINNLMDELNKSIQEDLKKQKNGYSVSDPLSNQVFNLLKRGRQEVS